MEGFNLGQYLEEQRQAGQQDSEGAFTVAQDKALDKMARFSLPGKFDWALKIVQAANAWNCDFLQVRQTRIATSFYFRPPDDQFPQDHIIVQALKHGSTDKDGPIHELCTALRALVDQVGLSFVLATRRGDEMGSPIFFGDDVGRLSERARRRWTYLRKPGLRLTVSHFRGDESFTGRYIPTLAGVARRSLDIADTLARRAYCSPVPIYLDGRDLTNPFCHRDIGQSLYYRPVALGLFENDELIFDTYPVLANLRELQRPASLSREGKPWCWITTFDHLALKEYHYAASRPGNTIGLNYYRNRRHQIVWRRHGVVTHRTSWKSSAVASSLSIFMDASHARTDLTGLAVKLDEQDLKQANEMREKLRSWMPELYPKVSGMARTVALHAPFAMEQPFRAPQDAEELQAGFSVFTEGLGKLGSGSQEFIHAARRGWRNLVTRPQRNALLEDWKIFMHREIDQIYSNLALEMVNSTPT